MKNKGVIVVNKPADWTSFDVVNKIKHLTKIKRVGHLGTLDPMATGILLVTVGKATKLFDIMQEKQKTYVARFHFGAETDSLDATGKVIKTDNKIVTKSQIEKILPQFVGEIPQIPPKYSAKLVDGVRAYDLARKGVQFELKPKKVHIYSLEILDFSENELELKIVCGSGTYIRSICRDLAHELNTVAYMSSLVRTNVSNFSLKDAVNIADLNETNIDKFILPIKEVLDFQEIKLSETEKAKVLNGQIIDTNLTSGTYLLNDESDTIALVEIRKNKAKMSLFLG